MKQYYYSEEDNKKGPFSLKDFENINITNDTLIWYEGLNDWTPAKDLEEFASVLAVKPPPVPTEKAKHSATEPSTGKPQPENKIGSQGWIIAGFVFSVLGGYIGIIMGFNYAFGKYDKKTKRLGWIMVAVGFVGVTIWKLVNQSIH